MSIKRERGALTWLSQEINGISRGDTVAGMRKMEEMDSRIQARLANKEVDEDLERQGVLLVMCEVFGGDLHVHYN